MITTVNETPKPERTSDHQATSPDPDQAIRVRFRIRFAKTGLLRWISHRDLARLWERLLRRTDLKLSMTEGFHPKPRISFPSALALSVEGHDEVVEIETAQWMTASELLDRLVADNQPGLTIHRVDRLPEGFGKAQLVASEYEITVAEVDRVDEVKKAIDDLLARPTVTIQRKNKPATFNVADQIQQLRVDHRNIYLTLAASDGASLKPTDVLDLLGLTDWTKKGAMITRTRVVLDRELDANDPDVRAVASRTTDARESQTLTERPKQSHHHT